MNEAEADLELKEIYSDIIRRRGKLSDIFRVQSLNPKTIRCHLDFYVQLLFGSSPVSRADREFIAVLVSLFNNCPYCIEHHAEALRHYWKDTDRVTALIEGCRTINLEHRLSCLAMYVEKLTCSPAEICENDIQCLRECSFSDRAILDIVLIVGYFNFVNRLVLGLGVETSSEESQGYNY